VSIQDIAGNFEVAAFTGFGSYQLNDLRTFQHESLPQLGVDIRSTTNFPSYYYYQLSMLYYIRDKWGIGITGSFFSTGGRNHYKDYSGEYKFDMLTNARNIGVVFNRKINLKNGLFIIPEICAGIKLSDLKLMESHRVYADSTSSEFLVKSIGMWVEPRVRLMYMPLSFLGVGASIGYEYNLPSKNYLSTDHDRFLMLISKRENMRFDWSGLRPNINMIFTF